MFDFADNTELFLKITLLFQNYKAVIFLTLTLQHLSPKRKKYYIRPCEKSKFRS